MPIMSNSQRHVKKTKGKRTKPPAFYDLLDDARIRTYYPYRQVRPTSDLIDDAQISRNDSDILTVLMMPARESLACGPPRRLHACIKIICNLLTSTK